MNYVAIMTERGVSRKEVESIINQIIADKGGLPINEITPEKKIGDDLGIS